MTQHRGPSVETEAPIALSLYISLTILTAVLLLVLGLRFSDFHLDWIVLAVLCALGVVSWTWRERDVYFKLPLSFTSIVLLASVALTGPVGAAIVGAVANLGDVSRRQPLQVRVFNAAMMSTLGSVGGFVYLLAGGPAHIEQVFGARNVLVRLGLPFLVADVSQCLVNAVVLAGVVRLSRGVPMRRFIPGMLGTSGLAYIGYGVIGLLFVILWVPAGVGPFSALLVLAPLFVARWAFVQYGDEQRAHERTLNALVAAVETKDPATRGHSQRVAHLCVLIADAMSLGHQRTEALREAGMLHDIGMLGVPSRLIHKVGALTSDELAVVALHPVRGVEMIREIDFLQESVDGILHHHERFDGRGHPHGLKGAEIPEFARIIAVADAFDSLTTQGAGRPGFSTEGALAELRNRAGTHLDPAMVAALERALARHDWSAAELEPSAGATPGDRYDHDDPHESDLLASLAEQVRPDPERARSDASA